MSVQGLFGGREKVCVAIVQASPVFLDKNRTIKKAKQLISEAAAQHANLIVFPETWIPTYPYWTSAALGEDDAKKYARAMIALQDNSIRIPSEDTDQLSDAARNNHVHLVVGCNELSDIPGSRTIYNSMIFIDDEGRLLGKHRKLVPTLDERLVWGMGDGTDLNVYATKIGRIGGLICWENHMVLARATLIMKGEEFHVAVWPGSWYTDKRLSDADKAGGFCDLFPAIREHAFEAGAFVVSAAPVMTLNDVPTDFPYREKMNLDWACGGSAVVDPMGNFLVNPVFDKQTIVYANCAAESIKIAKAFFDSLGHYSRFDVARLELRQDHWSPFVKTNRKFTSSDLEAIAKKHNVDEEKVKKIYEELTESQGSV